MEDGHTFFDALAIAQKKGMVLTNAEELSQLISGPQFAKVVSKKGNDQPFIANNISYTSDGDILVTSREMNPFVNRFKEWVGRIDERSFPDHPEYVEAISKIRGAQLTGEDTKNALIRRTMFIHPEAVQKFIEPAIAALRAYSDSKGISVIAPWKYDSRAFHPAGETVKKKGEPYFISRIKDTRRIGGFFSGPDYHLTLDEGENLLKRSSEDLAKAIETGVLFVPRESISKFQDPRSEPPWALNRFPLESLAQEPMTRFLLGDNPEKFAEHLRSVGRNDFPIEFQTRSYVVGANECGGLTSFPRLRTVRPYISAAVYKAGSSLNHTPIYGVKK